MLSQTRFYIYDAASLVDLLPAVHLSIAFGSAFGCDEVGNSLKRRTDFIPLVVGSIPYCSRVAILRVFVISVNPLGRAWRTVLVQVPKRHVVAAASIVVHCHAAKSFAIWNIATAERRHQSIFRILY